VTGIRWFIVGLLSVVVSLAPTAERSLADDADDQLIELVLNLLGDSDKEIRALGFEQVRTEAKGEAATKRFAAHLSKATPEVQAGLLGALADRGDKAALPAVLELLSASRDESVRVAAIGAVGTLGELANLPLFMRLLASNSKAEQAAARASLVRLRGEKVPAAIAAEMKRAPTALRVTLIEILLARRALDTIPAILEASVDGDPAVRTAAMAALGQLAGSEHVRGMVDGVLAAKKGPERDAAERAIMQVCSRVANEQKRAEPLLLAMEKLPDEKQIELLPALGRVGGNEALRVIEAAIGDPSRHDMGIRALCNWPDASTAPRLIELAKTDEHSEHQAMTLAALIRVAPLPDGRPDRKKLELVRTVMDMCTSEVQRNLVLRRASAIRIVETLRFVLPYLDQPLYAEQACETVVELAHHRALREPHKAEFHRALDKVLATSKDAVVVDRANRYKKDQTWVRPAAKKAR
jgi:HEAT repeat protein